MFKATLSQNPHKNLLKNILLCLSFLHSFVLAQEVYLVEDPWYPYTIGELSQEPQGGSVVEILKEIFPSPKYELKLKLYPWKRAIEMAQQGVADGLMLTLETQQRKKFFLFSNTLFVDDILFFKRKKENITFEDFESLKGLSIATIRGSKYSDAFQEALEQKIFAIEASDSIELNIQKLINKRVDLTIILKSVADEIFKSKPELFKKIEPLNKPLATKEFKIAISKKSKLSKEMGYINEKITQLQAK